MYIQHFIKCPFCPKNLRDDLTIHCRYSCSCTFEYVVKYTDYNASKIYSEVYYTNKYIIYNYAGFKDTVFFRKGEVVSFFYIQNKIAPYLFTDEQVENYIMIS